MLSVRDKMIFKYTDMENAEKIPQPLKLRNERIFLWGAGKIGSVVAYALQKQGIEFVAFIDSARDKQGTTYCNHKIVSPEEFYKEEKDVLVICSCAFPNILNELIKKGYSKAYAPVFLLKEIDFIEYKGELNVEYAMRITEGAIRNYILYFNPIENKSRLLFAITDKCSLRCKNCDGYMPYHTNPQNDSYNNIIISYERIIEVCRYVDKIDIFGGEPLVHPEIDKIVKFFVDDKRCDNIFIITNGTIVPSSKLLDILKSSKCTVRISDYGNLSSKKNKLIEIFNSEKIKYEITNYQYWDKVPQIQTTNETDEQLDSKFDACLANVLFYIKNGKMFNCVFTMAISSLQEELIPNFDKNYVELIKGKPETIEENIKKFMQSTYSKKHIDACQYCPGSHCLQFEDKQPVAEQADGILPIENLFKDGKRI